MGKAARAIIIEDGKLLVMHRNKYGSQYYTLVGGRLLEGESVEQALVREIKEETGLEITNAQLVFTEEHAAPYNDQYIYLCKVAPHGDIAVQEGSEEGMMNRIDLNVHRPTWAELRTLDRLPFRTPQLQRAILLGVQKGFPTQPVKLT